MPRVVGHLDLDYFYAQVEELGNPSLKGTPVVVCVFSGRTSDSGVVSTANYKAREHGVKSGIPISAAKRMLAGTNAVFLPMAREKYEGVSERIMAIAKARVDVLEQTGIDEAFFDITKASEGDFEKSRPIAVEIKRAILLEEGLTSSVGIGPNKLLAKIASDFRKPDGLTLVRHDEVGTFLTAMSVNKLYGVGHKTSEILSKNGIHTIGELADARLEHLERLFNRRIALQLHQSAMGVDEEPVIERGEALQIGRIITLKRNSNDASEILEQLAPAIEDVWKKSLEKGFGFRSVAIIGIAADLSVKTRNKTLDFPVNAAGNLRDISSTLLDELLKETESEFRRAGVRISNFTSTKGQASLLEYTRP